MSSSTTAIFSTFITSNTIIPCDVIKIKQEISTLLSERRRIHCYSKWVMMYPFYTIGIKLLWKSIYIWCSHFFTFQILQPLQRQISCDSANKSHKVVWPCRWNGIPNSDIYIVDTFFIVLMISRNVVCDIMAEFSIFRINFFNCLFNPVQVKIYNFFVLPCCSPLCLFSLKALSYIRYVFTRCWSYENRNLFKTTFFLSFQYV